MIGIVLAHPRLSVPVRQLKKQLTPHLAEMGINGKVTIRLSEDEEVKRLNQQFRKMNKTTDVLSFPIMESFPDGYYLGDIVISLDRAANQAEENGRKISEEVILLIIHGLLHLAGFDHEGDDGEMMKFQDKIYRCIIGKRS